MQPFCCSFRASSSPDRPRTKDKFHACPGAPQKQARRDLSGGCGLPAGTDIIVVLKMIHPELLSRLCHARDLLRDLEDEPVSVNAVARTSGLTRFHFIRLF